MSVRPEEFDHRYTQAAEQVAARRARKPMPKASALAAVLFIPPGPAAEAWRDICAEYCHDHRYSIVAIATTWAAVIAVLAQGEASVAVIGRREHLSTDDLPRLEFVNEPAREIPPGQRRPNPRG